MKAWQVIGWTLLQTTAITSIVSASTSVSYGLRPIGSTLPAINYYEVGGMSRVSGLGVQRYSINCRATSASTARTLGDLVIDLFAGTSGTGVYGVQNNTFEISRASLENDGGLIPEPDNNCYNVPIDIQIVYPLSTVS